MNITNVKYVSDSIIDADGNTEKFNVSVTANIDGEPMAVPLEPANRHYAEILKQVADGDLTIADAD